MSRSQPTGGSKNPAKKFIEFKKGKFVYYDKAQEKNIGLKYPVEFVVLDELTTIKGWHGTDECGITSNEVHNTTKEELSVRTYQGRDIAKGLYANIKDTIKAAGGKYTRSLYAMMEGELVNFQLKGLAFSQWITATKENPSMQDEGDCKVLVSKTTEVEVAGNKHKAPVFTATTMLFLNLVNIIYFFKSSGFSWAFPITSNSSTTTPCPQSAISNEPANSPVV